MSRSLSLAFGCLLGFASLGVGAWALSLELAPSGLGHTGVQRAINMQAPQSGAALSTLSHNEALLDCANALQSLQSIEARYLADAQREAIVPNCVGLTNHILAETPTHSYALYVRALAASTQSDWASMNADLALSARTGPTEQWIGEQRALLAARYREQLDPQTVATNDADLSMLARSGRGVRAIAALYLGDVGFREHITQIVEGLPPEDQERFVDNVRRAARDLQRARS